MPEIDLGFAIAAGSLDADETFQLMKDTISKIVTEYGLATIRYGLIVFGDTADIKIQFSNLTKVENLLRYISVVPKKKSGAALDEMLKEAETMFSAAGGRPRARKVLVVITDLASGKPASQVREAAKTLEDKDIKVVAVAVGREADSKELELLTSTDNIIEEQKNVLPNDLKEAIMVKVLKGNLICCRLID